MNEQPARFKTEAFITPAGTPEADFVWFFYPMGRANFISKHPELYQEQSGVVIPTFDEELAGRFILVDGTENCVKQGKGAPSQYLADVLRIHQAGFLKEYVWSYCNQPSWPDAQQPEKLLSFIAWTKANLKAHTLETHGGVKIALERPFSGQCAGTGSHIDLQDAGGRELNPLVGQIASAIQTGNDEEARRLLGTFSQFARNLRREMDAAFYCFLSQRQLNYFLQIRPQPPKARVLDWGVAWGSYLNAFLMAKSRRFAEALSELETVLKIAPFFARGWNEKGYILMNLRRPEEALSAYRHAWKLVVRHPENFDVAASILRGQAVALVELEDLDLGEKLLSDSLLLEPGDTSAMRERAYIAQRRKGAATRLATVFVERTEEDNYRRLTEPEPTKGTKTRSFIVGEDGQTRVDY